MKLAINGGEKIRTKPFPAQKTIGREEKEALCHFLSIFPRDKNSYWEYPIPITLSGYRGSWSKYFYGGEHVQALEKEFSNKFNIQYSIAVNSCTSALIIACGAIGLESGDEVIVTPWSMTCSATAPLIYGAIPIFADIEKDYFCLDPEDIKRKITSRTKAIIVVDLFGQPFAKEIRDIALKHNLYIIEDAAQAIGSTYELEWYGEKGTKFAGTLGDIGCFSFTQGKHLTSGEGGMIVTNNKDLAMKCQLIRNHAESVINDMDMLTEFIWKDEPNMVGFNMRMTELQAVILREQLKKLDSYIKMRQENVKKINTLIENIPAIEPTPTRPDCTHVYYVQGFKWNQDKAEGLHRDKFIQAVNAELSGEEGRPDRPMLGCGYIKPIYLMPLFQTRNHWTYKFEQGGINSPSLTNYQWGSCPVCEELWKNKFFLSLYHNLPLSDTDINDLIEAFMKVWLNKREVE